MPSNPPGLPIGLGLPPINYADEHIYEHLSLIIDEFEKAALRSGRRQAIMATAQNPLSAMDQILESSDRALGMGRTANASRVSSRSGGSSDGWEAPGFRLEGSGLNDSDEEIVDEPWADSHNDLNWVQQSEDLRPGADTRTPADDAPLPEPSFTVGTQGSFGFDADLNELMNGDPGGAQMGDWIKECFGCDLRLSFNWQLQPIDLLLPIGNFLGDINNALGKFDNFFDENKLIASLCDLLNGLNFLCIPDLLAILMALKMLLKSYLTFQFSLKVDWSVLLGPILKLILDAIVTLLQQVAAIIVAPLDCAYAALMSVSALQDELAATAALAAAVGARIADNVKDFSNDDGKFALADNTTDVEHRFKDVSTASFNVDGNQDEGGLLPDVNIPALSVSARDGTQEAKKGSAFSFPTGFEIDSNTRLPDALKIPEFLQSNPFKQLALSVKEARDYIMDLVRNIILALRSLEGLVSGGLSLSLGNLGLILFIQDMIRLILIIIRLFQGERPSDWCEHLQNNPELLETVMPGTTSRSDREREVIILSRGPEVVAEINTCSTGRTDAQASLMKKWVSDLKRSGSV